MSWNIAQEKYVEEKRHRDETQRQKDIENQMIYETEQKENNLNKIEREKIAEENRRIRRDHILEEKIGEKLFQSVIDQIENDENIRNKIYQYISEGRMDGRGVIELINSPLKPVGGISTIIIDVQNFFYGPNSYRPEEFAESFNGKKISPYKIKHPDCKGYEIVFDYCTSYSLWNINKPWIRVYIRKTH